MYQVGNASKERALLGEGAVRFGHCGRFGVSVAAFW